MAEFQTALWIFLICFIVLTLILGGTGLYLTLKGKGKRHPGLATACQVVVYQTTMLIGVVEHNWAIIAVSLVFDLMLVVSLIARDRQR